MEVVNREEHQTAIDSPRAGDSSTSVDGARARHYSVDEMEKAADALLEAAGVLGHTSGIYTRARLDRKMRNERRHMRRLSECEVPEEVIDRLVEQHLDDLVDASSLSASDETIFRLYLGGSSCRDMAATLGIKHQAIAFRLRRAIRKVRTSYREGRYAGWYEVYLSEVNRPVYRSRRRRASAR